MFNPEPVPGQNLVRIRYLGCLQNGDWVWEGFPRSILTYIWVQCQEEVTLESIQSALTCPRSRYHLIDD